MQMNDQVKNYCHLLNSTLTATERTLCCILENYQTPDGVRVPEVLQPFMLGTDFLPFTAPPKKDAKDTKKDVIAKKPPAKVPKLSHVGSSFSSVVWSSLKLMSQL